VHNKSLFNQAKRYHAGALNVRGMKSLIPPADSEAVDCLKLYGHHKAVQDLEDLPKTAVVGEDWVVEVSNKLVFAHEDGWAAVEFTLDESDVDLTDDQRKLLKEFRKESKEEGIRPSKKPFLGYQQYQGSQQRAGSYESLLIAQY
jgi:hypothetical protein